MNALAPTAQGQIRADRKAPGAYQLAKPRTLGSGGVVFEGVLSTPGLNRYPTLGRVERVEREALSDPEYLAGLVGLPLILADDRIHWQGVTPAEIARVKLGTLLSARYDMEQDATLVEIVVDTQRGLDKIRRDGMTGLSLHYQPDTAPSDGEDGSTHVQKRRTGLNHVLLTDTPNDTPARLRADQRGQIMTDEQFAKLLAAAKGEARADSDVLSMLLEMLMTARADAKDYKDRADEMEQKLADAMTPPEGEEDDEPRADAWRQVVTLAEKAGATIPDDATLAGARLAVVAKVLPSRADAEGDVLEVAWDLVSAQLEAQPEPKPPARNTAHQPGRRADSNSRPSAVNAL